MFPERHALWRCVFELEIVQRRLDIVPVIKEKMEHTHTSAELIQGDILNNVHLRVNLFLFERQLPSAG